MLHEPLLDLLRTYFRVATRYHRNGTNNAIVRTVARFELERLHDRVTSPALRRALARILHKPPTNSDDQLG